MHVFIIDIFRYISIVCFFFRKIFTFKSNIECIWLCTRISIYERKNCCKRGVRDKLLSILLYLDITKQFIGEYNIYIWLDSKRLPCCRSVHESDVVPKVDFIYRTKYQSSCKLFLIFVNIYFRLLLLLFFL